MELDKCDFFESRYLVKGSSTRPKLQLGPSSSKWKLKSNQESPWKRKPAPVVEDIEE